MQLVPALRKKGRIKMHEHNAGDQTPLATPVPVPLGLNGKRWLDGIPYKELFWHPGFDQLRKFTSDNMVALQVECAVLNRIISSDDPPDILAKLSVTAAWLDERM